MLYGSETRPIKENGVIRLEKTLHKKWSFPFRISSVNVTKSTVLVQILSYLLIKSLMENFIFYVEKMMQRRLDECVM